MDAKNLQACVCSETTRAGGGEGAREGEGEGSECQSKRFEHYFMCMYAFICVHMFLCMHAHGS